MKIKVFIYLHFFFCWIRIRNNNSGSMRIRISNTVFRNNFVQFLQIHQGPTLTVSSVAYLSEQIFVRIWIFNRKKIQRVNFFSSTFYSEFVFFYQIRIVLCYSQSSFFFLICWLSYIKK